MEVVWALERGLSGMAVGRTVEAMQRMSGVDAGDEGIRIQPVVENGGGMGRMLLNEPMTVNELSDRL